MKNILIYIFIALFALVGLRIEAQIDVPKYRQYEDFSYENLMKYWNIRSLMRQKMVKIADVPGGGIPFNLDVPAACRSDWNFEFQTGYDPLNSYCLDTYRNVNGCGVISNPDPGNGLGIYMAVLATEHELLRRNNQWDELNQQNIPEMYYAIRALERMIAKGNQDFNDATGGNGFSGCWFIRNDADPYFWQHFSDPAKGGWSCNKVCPGKYPAIPNGGTDANNYTSIDQTIYLLLGMILIKKYVPPTVSYNNVLLVDKVEALTEIIIAQWYNDEKWFCEMPNGQILGQNSVLPGLGSDTYGQDARFYAYPLDHIGQYITGNIHGNWDPVFDCPNWNVLDDAIEAVFDGGGVVADAMSWLLSHALAPADELCEDFFNDHDGQYITMWKLAMANSQTLQLGSSYNLVQIDLLGAMSNKYPAILNYMKNKNSRPIIPLIQTLLHSGNGTFGLTFQDFLPLTTVKTEISNTLDKAPCHMLCRGYCPQTAADNCTTPSVGFQGKDEWYAGERWFVNNLDDIHTPYVDTLQNGLFYWGGEFLLGYNLYQLAFTPDMLYANTSSTLTPSMEFGSNNPAEPLVYPSTLVTGTIDHPLNTTGVKIEVENLRVENDKFFLVPEYPTSTTTNTPTYNTVYADGKVNIRGGQEIVFKQGVVIEAGAELKAYIAPFSCNPVNGNIEDSPMKYKGTDMAEEHSLSRISSSTEIFTFGELNTKVYPNPTNDIINIEVEGNNETLVSDIQICDLQGKIILSLSPTIEHIYSLDLSGLDSGLYILKINLGHYFVTYKIIKL
jgi:hypothetical protein